MPNLQFQWPFLGELWHSGWVTKYIAHDRRITTSQEFSNDVIIYQLLPSLKLTARTWTCMVWRWVSFWGPAYFQVLCLLVSGSVILPSTFSASMTSWLLPRRSLPKKRLATRFPLEHATASTSSRPRVAKAWSWKPWKSPHNISQNKAGKSNVENIAEFGSAFSCGNDDFKMDQRFSWHQRSLASYGTGMNISAFECWPRNPQLQVLSSYMFISYFVLVPGHCASNACIHIYIYLHICTDVSMTSPILDMTK